MRIHFRIEAAADLAGICVYISEHDPQASQRVGDAIRSTVSRLEMFPYSGRRGAVAGTYELVVPGLPYIVVYRVSDFVEILSVFHAATDRPQA